MRYPPADQHNLRAPRSQFRVVAMDTEETASLYQIGDFLSLEAAQSAASDRARVGHPVFIYNEDGKLVVRFGSWH